MTAPEPLGAGGVLRECSRGQQGDQGYSRGCLGCGVWPSTICYGALPVSSIT
jgi:hypothetical protein